MLKSFRVKLLSFTEDCDLGKLAILRYAVALIIGIMSVDRGSLNPRIPFLSSLIKP